MGKGGTKYGLFRRSLAKAKEDAMRLGKEAIEDYFVALARLAKRLGSNEI